MNTVTITGNLADDPTLNFLPSGRPVLNIDIANNELVNGESKLNGFFTVSLFGDQAKRLGEELRKGDSVLVAGRLQQNSWKREDQSTGRKVVIIAQTIAPTAQFRNVRVDRTDESEEE